MRSYYGELAKCALSDLNIPCVSYTTFDKTLEEQCHSNFDHQGMSKLDGPMIDAKHSSADKIGSLTITSTLEQVHEKLAYSKTFRRFFAPGNYAYNIVFFFASHIDITITSKSQLHEPWIQT